MTKLERSHVCRSCPQEHPMYLQAEPDWYRPSLGEQITQAVGCAASMAGILIAAVVVWGLLIALFVGATNV